MLEHEKRSVSVRAGYLCSIRSSFQNLHKYKYINKSNMYGYGLSYSLFVINKIPFISSACSSWPMVGGESNGSWRLRLCCESTVMTWTEVTRELRTSCARESVGVKSALHLNAPEQEQHSFV